MAVNVTKFVFDNLIKFTKMPEHIVKQYVDRIKPHHGHEWNLWKPTCKDEIDWFYVCSRSYLFSNAVHVMEQELYNVIPNNTTVFDFGGGSGGYTLPLVLDKNVQVYYFDINLVQKEFLKFIKKTHNLSNLHIVDHDDNYLPLVDDNIFDYIISTDVFEHVPNYPRYVKKFSNMLKQDCELFTCNCFGNGGDCHLADEFGFNKVCVENNLIKQPNLMATIERFKKC